MKLKFIFLGILVFLISLKTNAQFDKPSFQLTFGISQPYNELKGDNYININPEGYIFVDSNLFATNLGAKTGIQFGGSAKFNFDKYNITRGVLFASYTSFNTFQSSQSGTTLLKFINNTYQPRSVTFDYSINNFAIGFGLEIAPLSFTNIFSPFFGANLSLNFLSADLKRTTSINDSNSAMLSSFRIGVNFNAGIEAKINNNIGVVAGIKYDLGNLLFKDSKRDGFIEWGSKDANINDEEERYISNLYYAIGEAYNYFQSQRKDINWGTIYIGINIYPDLGGSKKPKTKTPKRSMNF